MRILSKMHTGLEWNYVGFVHKFGDSRYSPKHKAMLLRLSLSPSKTSLWGKKVWKRRVCVSGVVATFSLAGPAAIRENPGKKFFLLASPDMVLLPKIGLCRASKSGYSFHANSSAYRVRWPELGVKNIFVCL